MTRDKLDHVADALRSAADSTEDQATRDRLQTQAEQFENMASADRGPDHGRLARHEHVLREIKQQDASVTADIDRGLEAISGYRETLEGV